jgi:rare lipoprotein A
MLCGFMTLLVFSFTGCGAFHNAQMNEMDKIQFGLASWYGNQFHGGKTSSGELYDMNSFTAAHRMLPFGTIIKVTNIKNGRNALVKINDRGPHKSSRKLDLSYVAAKKIGMLNDGIVRVRIEVVDDSYAMMLYEEQKESWRVYNIDTHDFDESIAPFGMRTSLPITQFITKNGFIAIKFDKTSIGMYKDIGNPTMLVASGSSLSR